MMLAFLFHPMFNKSTRMIRILKRVHNDLRLIREAMVEAQHYAGDAGLKLNIALVDKKLKTLESYISRLEN